jgi:hypothetical protein
MKYRIASPDKRLNQRRIPNVAFDKLKTGLALKRFDILQVAGAKIVNYNNLNALGNQPFGKMRPDKTRSTRN